MATNGHGKKPSEGSAQDFTPSSPSKLPRPASRASATRASREAPTLRESLQYVADRNRLAAQGSPSPAPRPSRQTPNSTDHRPLAHLFPDKPIELGRTSSTKRPRRDNVLATKTSFGPLSHNEGDTDEEFERKLKKFEADERVFEKLLKEERNGPFAQRKVVGSSIARPMSARGGATRPSNGNRDQVFAETGYGRQTNMARRLQQLEQDPEVLANHFNFLTGTDQGVKRKFASHFAGDMSHDPPLRPATSAPTIPGTSWEIEDDFTAGSIQGSTSPPVSFGRSNTRIDELRQREIDAARQFPTSNKPLFMPRNNTKLDEIARMEKEVVSMYPLNKSEESLSSPIRDLPTIDEQPEGENGRARYTTSKSRLDEVRDRVSRERLAQERLSSAAEGQRNDTREAPDVPQRSSLRDSPKSKESSEGGKSDRNGNKISNTPVTVYDGGVRNNSRDVHDQPSSKDDVPTLSQQEPTPPKEDPHDLLRRLSRASSKSPSPTPAQDDAASNSEREANVRVEPVPEGKVASEYKFLNASKPAVGFSGISRSNSSNSVNSKASVLSGDPSARIAAEAKLFALDNFSERGSLRAPSPVSETAVEFESDKAITDLDDEETPRAGKSVDVFSMPTPVVTGAFIETPAPVKSGEGMEVSPKKIVTQDRDSSISPRASKSDSQREVGRPKSTNDPKRSKSTSRNRSSPVKNTAKPPSVKDDLRQIYQRNNIEDSEVDELTGLVMAAENPEEVARLLKTKAEDDIKDWPENEHMKKMNAMTEALNTGLAQIRNAKRGIERLEGQVSRPGVPIQNTDQNQGVQPVNIIVPGVNQDDSFVYIPMPIPKLYRRTPKVRLTLMGLFLLVLFLYQLYWVIEGLFYDQWGKQKVCYRGETCRWNMDDPEYGYVIPVKLDEWITGGAIRPHAAHWLEEVQDGWADVEDWVTATDIRQIQHQAIRDPVKKAQYWRRIEKKGLFPKWKPAEWLLPEIEEWDRQARAREAAEASDALGHEFDDRDDPFNDSMDKDQPISGDETVGRLW